MLVILRVTIGWHFYTEGVEKRQSGTWTATPFFANASGPFAGEFRKMVWDWDGTYRLNSAWFMKTFAVFREQAKQHFGFDDKQADQAQANYAKAIEQYDWVMSENAAELEGVRVGPRANFENEHQWWPRKSFATVFRAWVGSATRFDASGRPRRPRPSSRSTRSGRTTKRTRTGLLPTCSDRPHGYLNFVKPRTNRIDTSVIDRIIPLL